MTYEQFWHGETMAAAAYRKKFDIDRDNRNMEMWLQGMYDHEAFGVVLANAFKKKGATASRYTEEPYPIRPLTEEEQAAKEEKEIQKTYAYFDQLMAAQKARRKQQHGDQDR